MNPTSVGIVVFACTFGGALVGMILRKRLPAHHLSDESRDAIKLGIGLIATMTALVLGLITASAKGSFDEINAAIKHAAADTLSLDRTLARYGSGASEARAALKRSVANRIDAIWPSGASRGAVPDSVVAPPDIEQLAEQVRALRPENDDQRWLQSRSLQLAESLFSTRLLVITNVGSSIPLPFLMMLLFWLTITFASFGLFAPRNATVVCTLLLCALSVGGAVFLVLEMDRPFEGVIAVSSDPLRFALAKLNQ